MGGDLNVGAAKGGGKRAKTRKVEEEIRRARTRHATAAKLLEALHARESIGVVDGPLDTEVAAELSAGMVLQFRAELRLHPLHQLDQMMRSFLSIAPKFGQDTAAAGLRQVLEQWAAMVGTGQPDSRVLVDPRTYHPQRPRLVLPVPRDDIEIDVEDVLGEVTVIAQVERLLTDDDIYPAMRLLRGATTTTLEQDAVSETFPELIPAMMELGVEISPDDIHMPAPVILLRAICAYR